jgi:hypothetical protein
MKQGNSVASKAAKKNCTGHRISGLCHLPPRPQAQPLNPA